MPEKLRMTRAQYVKYQQDLLDEMEKQVKLEAEKMALMMPLKAKENFYTFCVYMDPVFFTEGKPHLKQIAEAFQQVAEGKIKKLAVSLPPRAGKSYITSLFCAWMLGRNPEGSIMRNSYAAKLAEKFSKDIRDGILLNPKYQEVFPGVAINPNNAAVDGWSLGKNTQPSYFCAGVGGPITGFGCKLLAILDDPLKNIEEALSEITIESLWNWYTSTHLSRLETGCPEIHIATRWSKKDPIGRLTDPHSPAYDKDMVVIVISALDAEGNSFCEAVKTTEEYHKIKNITEDFIWEAEYMQNPIESKGLLFPVEELKRFKLKETEGKTFDAIVGVTDTADEGTDYLCSPVGKKMGDYTYLTDVVFTQDPIEITEPLVAQQIIDSDCEVMKVESNSGGKSFALNVEKLIKGKSTCDVFFEPQTANKETRILMNAGYIKKHFYFRDDYAPGSDYDHFMRWFTSYVRLGKNKHDDSVDGVTMMAEYVKLLGSTPIKKKPPVGFYTECELKDRGFKPYEIKQIMKTMPKSWEKVAK
jgi:predicted phage terminase large subunit-like protein